MKIGFWQQRQFKRYLERNWQRLYRLAYAWCHHPQTAHDLLQETLSKSLKAHYHFDNEKALDVWLYKVMANCWRDQCRRRRETVEMDQVSLASHTDLEDEQYQREISISIQRGMARLSMTHRQIITLVDLQELAYHEVAEILDIPAGTVMSRLCRARKQLRAYLQDAGVHSTQDKTTVRRIK